MQRCEVLVIGGGPAGSSCATTLRTLGLDVLLIDQSVFPRDKVCAGWITPAVVRILGLDLEDYRRNRVLQPILGLRTGLVGGRQQNHRYAEPVSWGIRRIEFDDYLLRRAGVRLRLGLAVRDIVRQDGLWVVNGYYAAPMLVGAGGHFCPVSRLLEQGRNAGAVVVAREAEFLMNEAQWRASGLQADTPELFFCHDLRGYGWCLRKNGYLNIGLGREDRLGLPSHLDHFCRWLQQRGTLPAHLEPAFRGHAYRLWGNGPERQVGDGVALVGDAAGLARAQSGEGILPAIASGQWAAHAIAQARGDYRAARLQPYEERLAQALGAPSRPGTRPEATASWRQGLGRALLGSAWFSRHVLLDRWFLRPPRLSATS